MEKTIEKVIKQLSKYGLEVTPDEAHQIIIQTIGESYALEAFLQTVRKDILLALIGGVTIGGIYTAVGLLKSKKAKTE